MAIIIGSSVNESLTVEQRLDKIKDISIEEVKLNLIKLKPEREQQFRDSYDCVVVNEFGDDYHKSEEERKRENKYYELFRDYKVGKSKYSKIPEFIKAYRKALKCLDAVANDQDMYDIEKFKKMVLRGKIYISGLDFPKLKKRYSKEISMEYLSEFIMSDEAPEDFKKEVDVLLTPDEKDNLEDIILSEDEKEDILREKSIEECRILKGEEEEKDGYASFSSEKENKKIMKAIPDFIFFIKDTVKKDTRIGEHLQDYVYNLTSSDIENITKYSKIHDEEKVMREAPVFTGNLMNKKDYNKFLADVFEWENNCVKIDFNGKLKTREEIRSIELAQALEEEGWNLRNLYDNKEKEKKLKRLKKLDNKKKKELKKKLVQLEERRNKRHLGEDYDKKKNNKKSKSKKKKVDKDIDKFLLENTGKKEKSLKDYENKVTDFTWDLGED